MVHCQVHCSMYPSQWRLRHSAQHSCLHSQAAQYILDRPLPIPVSDVASRQHLRSATASRLLLESWYFRGTGCKYTTDGLFLWLVLRPGTYCLTVWQIRLSPETASADFLKHICSLCTDEAFSRQRIRGFTKMRYTNLLLTYLLTYK